MRDERVREKVLARPRAGYGPAMRQASLVAAVAVTLAVVALAAAVWARGRRRFGTPAQRATYDVLHTAAAAAPALRLGLTLPGATKATRPVHELLGSAAVALTDTAHVLSWDGVGDHHRDRLEQRLPAVVESGRPYVVAARELACDVEGCRIRRGVVVPLVDGDQTVGTLATFDFDLNARVRQ
jgi:two-component system LytT family sensor kinase